MPLQSFTPLLAIGGLGPLGILAISVVFIVVAIVWMRLHAFFALMLAAMLAGLLTVWSGAATMTMVEAVEAVMVEMGVMAGKIGFVIAMAAVIGACLMESGAADRIVRTFVGAFGEKRAGLAMLASGFVLSVPVFFDTVFFLLLPLARALARRTGRDYVFYVLAICAGGVITHSTVPPTPGPLVMSDMLSIKTGIAIAGGAVFGIFPAAAGLWLSRWLAQRNPIPVRPAAGDEDHTAPERDGDTGPSFALSILPVVVPVAMITALAFVELGLGTDAAADPGALMTTLGFLGNKNIAMLVGMLLALWLWIRQRRDPISLSALMSGPLEAAGVIVLITSAGGAFGAMIKNAGLGDSVRALAENHGLNYVLLAWILAVIIRVAQGSGTVAMITTTGIMTAVAGPDGFGVSPLYIYVAIGYGSICLSWMNDSGFWVVSRLSGFTEREALRTWTVLLTAISIVGLVEAWVFSTVLPNGFGG